MRLKHLALGQGMGARAAEAVEAGAARGLWVLLQNCHLLPRWLPALDALLEGLERPHKARPSPVCCCAGGSPVSKEDSVLPTSSDARLVIKLGQRAPVHCCEF